MTHAVITFQNGCLPPAPPGMEDIWQRIGDLMAHQTSLLAAEHAIQAQQRGMVRDGCFLMPSPYPDRSEDVCTRSWCHEYQFFYEFGTGKPDRYFWVSGQLDRAYALDTIWFPDRRIAITNFRLSASLGLFDRFEQMLTWSPPKPVWAAPPNLVPRVVVTGFQHLMHMMWNQYPALDKLAAELSPDSFAVGVLCEPFGPTESVYPELADVIQHIRNEDVPAENARNGLMVGLGSWTITSNTQARVRRVCATEAGSVVAERRNRFRAAHHPVFWVSVKPPKRTMSDQAETLAALLSALRAAHPSAGFILNGASYPWDMHGNSNYPPWFQTFAQDAIANSAVIIEGVVDRVPTTVREHIVVMNNVTACEEVVWGEIAAFYICHGGTMQNKIGWIHQTPGYIHSNRTFLRNYRMMPPPVTPTPACFYAPDDIIIDDDPSNYTATELARKDQNYRCISAAALIESVMEAIRSVDLT